MKIYMDVSCLNRPFDDQRQGRIRLEAESVVSILRNFDAGIWRHLSSEMVRIEILAMPDSERRKRVLRMLPAADAIIQIDEGILARANELCRIRMRPTDAVHVAAAEIGSADAFVTCDDQIIRVARRRPEALRVIITGPIDWIEHYEERPNA